MKRLLSLGALMGIALSGSTTLATCYNDFSTIQYLGSSLTDLARNNLNTISSMQQNAARLRQDLGSSGAAPQFAQSLNAQVEAAKSESVGSGQALSNATSLINNDYEQEYQKAIAMVCEGSCSPGITNSLHHMHDIVQNALSNVSTSNQHIQAVGSDLQNVENGINQAQAQVNGSGSNSDAIQQLQALDYAISNLAQATQNLVGDSFNQGNSLRALTNDLSQFSSRGCVNANSF